MTAHQQAISRLLLCALCLSAVPSHAQPSKQDIGTAIGGVLGGLLGNKAGKGSGRVAATVAGAVVGGVIGNQIGKYLDERDRPQATAAAQQALESDKTQTWSNPQTGNSGTVQIVSLATPLAPPQSQATEGNQTSAAQPKVCKTIRQTITLKDGSTRDEDVTACKGANGWETA